MELTPILFKNVSLTEIRTKHKMWELMNREGV